MKMSYGRFAAMIGTATVIVFGLMYSGPRPYLRPWVR
jgi:hypothetical protein